MTLQHSRPEVPEIRALLVEDDEDDYRLTLAVTREITGCRIRLDWSRDFDDALESICRGEHDIYLIDYRLGEKTGIDLLNSLKERKCSGPFILLTGLGEPEVDRAAQAAGAADFLEKGRLDAVILERMIRYAIRQFHQETELERKVAERTAALEAANLVLRESDRRKDEFLATLAHELRNPLAPIRNSLELMKMMANEAGVVAKSRDVIDRQVAQLIRLINDLLDASRLSRGKLSLAPEPADLRDAVTLAVETSQPRIEKAGLTLELQLPDGPLPVHADRVRLTQVFSNILNNSSKYTPPGGTVRFAVEKDGPGYEVRISDTGSGIPAEHQKSVFNLFTQVGRCLHQNETGLGIGLALVKRLVEMHHGSVGLESPGDLGGTTVIIRLPIEQKQV